MPLHFISSIIEPKRLGPTVRRLFSYWLHSRKWFYWRTTAKTETSRSHVINCVSLSRESGLSGRQSWAESLTLIAGIPLRCSYHFKHIFLIDLNIFVQWKGKNVYIKNKNIKEIWNIHESVPRSAQSLRHSRICRFKWAYTWT